MLKYFLKNLFKKKKIILEKNNAVKNHKAPAIGISGLLLKYKNLLMNEL